MNRLYKNNELLFSLIWIIIYVVSMSLADSISMTLGIYKSFSAIIGILLCSILYYWIVKNKLKTKYGLCKSKLSSKQVLYYIPLLMMLLVNMVFSFSIQYTLLEVILFIISMFCVGFLEEIIFRGLLFKALSKDDLQSAILISSITFGIGHIVNIFNGSGVDLFSNLLQVVYAISVGFMFTILFLKSGSLNACILTHAIFNSLSIFSSATLVTPMMEIFSALLLCIISVVYSIYLIKMK